MTGYASNTGTLRNLAALRDSGWRLLLTPDSNRERPGLRHAIDNGAWGAFQKGTAFDGDAFMRLVDRSAPGADFVVIPDIVAGGLRSLELSMSWIPRLRGVPSPLLPVQDGMSVDLIRGVLSANAEMGIFLGGSTEWKLETMPLWGSLAMELGRHYHVGRVNTARRIWLCEEAGADSFDGTSASKFSCTLPLLEDARRRRSLFRTVPS